MTRVALYARYSSDNQRDASIEDQLRICREKAARENWIVVSTYKDAGISGASMILRPGIQTLLQDAQRQQFDVVLAEALDRISRDQADVATLFKHLRFAGVPIITLAEGEMMAPTCVGPRQGVHARSGGRRIFLGAVVDDAVMNGALSLAARRDLPRQNARQQPYLGRRVDHVRAAQQT